MAKKDFGLVVVGNALVDVLSEESEAFVAREVEAHGMARGAMTLISAERGEELYKVMGTQGTPIEMSGGSGANSLATFMAIDRAAGGAFIGKVADDEFGRIFRHDVTAQGIHFTTPVYTGPLETGRSYIIVTPDGERTMNTYLGASTELEAADIDEDVIARGKILLLEGYLFDRPKAREAFNKAAEAAHAHGTRVAFTLSDHHCVERHLADFKALADGHVDILIGNKKEIMALTGAETFEDAAAAAAQMCDTVVLTKGSKGALIIDKGVYHDIAPVRPEKLVDTTGAGDAFAGAVLYGLSQGMSPDRAGMLGARVASQVISHVGARLRGASYGHLVV